MSNEVTKEDIKILAGEVVRICMDNQNLFVACDKVEERVKRYAEIISKERAIGFLCWAEDNKYRRISEDWWFDDKSDSLTTEQLYDKYLETLKHIT